MTRNYLRARGEYGQHVKHLPHDLELPPRTRRIRLANKLELRPGGTTSAHAENTRRHSRPRHTSRNYLRARGEYRLKFTLRRLQLELPPRTRRILRDVLVASRKRGTTSAHAENTALMAVWCMTCWNYLRARGEYMNSFSSLLRLPELPPRTRRIHHLCNLIGGYPRTTSAHAENTRSV